MTKYQVNKRGATIAVEAYAEVLGFPGGDVANFKRRFSNKLQAFAAKEAPANKRPRWRHYGPKTLKQSMNRSSTRFVDTPGGFRLYGVVGSTAPYASFVDQGTGVYAGGSPWKAAVLPPYSEGSASLYEATWRPGGPPSAAYASPKVAPVFIKGQRPQFFMDKALVRTFAFMRMRQAQVPIDGQITAAIAGSPPSLIDSIGTDASYTGEGFEASLRQWRMWRDEAWDNFKPLGRSGGIGRKLSQKYSKQALKASGARARRYRKSPDYVLQRENVVRRLEKARKARRRRETAEVQAAKSLQKLSRNRLREQEEIENQATRERIAATRLEALRVKAYEFKNSKTGKKNYRDLRVLINKTGGFVRVTWINSQGETKVRDFKPKK